MSEHSIQYLREKLRLKGSDFAAKKHKFYAQGTFDSRCRVGKFTNKSHIYLYYDKRNEKFKIFKPGKNDDKYSIAEIDKKNIDYNYTHTTDGCIISYTDINTKKNCKVVLTPCDETKRKTKYVKCPTPDKHFDKPVPNLTNWKRLLNLWILESPSRDAVKSKSKPTRKSSPSTRKKTSPPARKTPSLSTRKSSPSTRKSPSRTQSKRGGAKKYHKATKKHRRKNIKKTRKNK
tara:strand:- start:4492 stop:5187 length:696 start_codon:yes stop_codon:yes gene_type:complete